MQSPNTIAELALAMPRAIPVLERLRIDYCCHGSQSIQQACSRATITSDELLTLINSEPAGGEARSWEGAPLTDIIHFIVGTHHTYTRTTLQTLQGLGAKVRGVHGARHPELAALERLVHELTADLMPHMMKEEQILFPYLDQLESGDAPPPMFGTVKNPIRMMMLEHDAAGEKMAEIRAAAIDFTPPPDACTSFTAFYIMLGELEQDLHRHIHLENNILFPSAVTLEESLDAVVAR
jgi:regulator of cell morphogenesis and NO signaling